MTQCRYLEPLSSFQLDKKPDPWYEVNIMEDGRKALEQVNDHLGNVTLHKHVSYHKYDGAMAKKNLKIIKNNMWHGLVWPTKLKISVY